MSSCDDFQKQITREALGEISSDERDSLELHVQNCVVCRRERERTLDVLSHLRQASDVSVPRHFYVYADSSARPARELFRALGMAWKLGFAGVLLGIALLLVFVAANVHARI